MAKTNKDIAFDFVNDLVKDIIANYDAIGLRASGNFERKTIGYVEENKKSLRVWIESPKYVGAMQFGRKPTSVFEKSTPTLREQIRQWIDDKGIVPSNPKTSKDALAYLITRKIHEKGVTVPNKHNMGGVISKVITDERIDELYQLMQERTLQNITSEILEYINKMKV